MKGEQGAGQRGSGWGVGGECQGRGWGETEPGGQRPGRPWHGLRAALLVIFSVILLIRKPRLRKLDKLAQLVQKWRTPGSDRTSVCLASKPLLSSPHCADGERGLHWWLMVLSQFF